MYLEKKGNFCDVLVIHLLKYIFSSVECLKKCLIYVTISTTALFALGFITMNVAIAAGAVAVARAIYLVRK